ncbi:MAG: Ig-like domain-containing protein [Clostridiales bacterium]|nr:Ig-like domain-containing protein [Clostridiales bacterium]
MNNSQLGKKILTVVIVFALALCLGICTFLGINANSSGGSAAGASSDNSGVLNSAAGDDVADFTYEFGKSYNINGVDYPLSNADSEYLQFKTALHLSDSDTSTIALTKFTYPDGTSVTNPDGFGGVRRAGLYEFTVTNGGTTVTKKVRVNQAVLDFSSPDSIPVFCNANNVQYKAHGDITAIYKHNDGWYPSQKSNEIPVEIRTITNAYYYETTTHGGFVTIKIADEKFTNSDYKTPSTDITSAYSTLRYKDTYIDIKISDRAGVQYKESNEYIATFKFNAPNNCVFDYGNVNDDDEIMDKNKGVSITQRTETSFVVVKHWFIVKYASLFVATDDIANYPYVPFHDKVKFDNAGGTTTNDTGTNEGDRGELNTAIDTITYGEDFVVKAPVSKFNSGFYTGEGTNRREIIKDGSVKFDVIYVDLDGKKHNVATNVSLDATGSVAQNTLSYYFNKTMPAGNYTLKLYGEIAQSEMAAGLSNKVQGEYWLTVLPAQLGKGTNLIDDIQNTIKGTAADGGFINSYLLSENKLHEDLSDEIAALNNSLNGNLGKINSYWNDKSQYFENAVTVKYNRDTWSSSTYVDYDDINGMINQAGIYKLYYSIAAKNYVTVGGPDDANRTDYGFTTKLSQGVSIKQIYDRLTNDDDPYFKDVTYTGAEVHTLVPRSQQYQESFNDEEGYINVRNRASVTLTLNNGSEGLLTGWENDVAGGDLGDRIELSDDRQTLTVYFDIVAATNSWTVAPQMSPWTYNAFNKDVNFISAGIAFSGAEVYYRLGKKTGNTYEWMSVDGSLTADDNPAPEYFTVDENGKVSDAVAEKLNALGAGTYYLGGYINASSDGNVSDYAMSEQAYIPVVVMQASNEWTTTPYILDWAYNGFKNSNIQVGATLFGNDDTDNKITYTLYEGNPTTGTLRETFYSLDEVGEDGKTVAQTLNELNVGTYTLVASKAGSDNYRPLSLQMTFVVYKATNSWTTTPFINSWAYKHFTSNNVRAGVAQFGAQITYDLREGDTAEGKLLHTFNSINDILTIDGNDVVVSAMLNVLPAKVYTIVASVADTPNYDGLSMAITFAVTKASNTWTTTPVMTGWAYKLFSTSNFQAGATELGVQSTITYTLYNGNPEDITEETAAKLVFNSINDDGVIDYFVALEKGTYTLIAHQVGEADYSELSQSMTFSVTKATNTWNTTPYITGWTYKQFGENNFQAGKAEFGVNADITYTLFAGDKAEGTPIKTAFKLTEDFKLTENDIDYFKALGQGTYTLLAHQGESESYYELNTPLTFTVSPTTNSWATKPRVIGWTYGSFDNSYFIAGIPTYQESKNDDDTAAVVEYTLSQKADDNSYTDIAMFTAAELYDFASLDAGSYKVSVSYAGTDNYAELTDEIVFTVGKYVNGWNPSPSLRGWSYKNFNSALFTAGVPAMQDDEDAVVTYKVTGDTLATAITLTVTNGALLQSSIDALTALAAGDYTLTATYAGTDNYDEITATSTFTVAQIDNSWATRPRLLGWTYGAFDSSYFIAGVPTLKEDDSVQVQYTLTKDGDESFTAATFTASDLYDFATLNAGAYTLSVSFAGTDNYEALDAEINFAVSPVNNTWDTQPTITSFVYKQFTEANSFVAGVPHYPLANKQVYYVISNSAIAEAKTLTAFQAITGEHFDLSNTVTLDSDTVDYLNGLGYGRYYFAVFVPESNNYSYLFYTGSFNVSQTNNYWQNATPPDISGWTYGAFAESMFKDGAPIHGTVEYTVRTVVNGNADAVVEIDGTSLSGLSYAAIKAKLNALNVGTYSMHATSGFTDDYTAAEWSKQFVISKADNEWDSTPSIVGWIYGQYDNSVNAVNVGTAKFGNLAAADYTYKYFVAVNENGTWVKGAAISASAINTANAGNYLLEVTADGNGNYNALVHTVNFVIERKELGWNIEPDDRLDWDRKNTEGLNNSTIVKASVQGITAYTLTYTVYSIDDDGMSQINDITVTVNGATRNDAGLITALKGLPVGTYRITVKAAVDATSNYETLEKNVSCTVSLAANAWNTELNGGTWTWGNSDTVLNALSAPDAVHGNDTIVFTVKEGATTLQTVRAADSDLDTAFGELKTYLGGRNVGTYTVTVSIAATADYVAPQSTTVEFTVNKVTTVWNAATTANNGKVYNWVLGGTNEAVAQPEIGTPASQLGSWGSTVNYKLLKGAQELYEGTAWSGLVTALGNCKAGEYTITAHIDGDTNHTALDYSVTVNIGAKANSWTEKTGDGNSIAKEFTKAYGADLSFIKFTPAHGTVVVTVNGKTTNDVIGYINTNGVSEYLIVATVTGTDEYGALVDTVRLTITKADNAWTKNLAISSGWTWSDNQNNIDTGLTLPVSAQGDTASVVVTVKQTGEVVLEATINYVRVDGVRTVSDNDLAALNSKIKALSVVNGGYTITVSVSDTDSYNSLSGQSANFVISKATNSWTANGKPKVDSWSFGGDTAYPSATPVFGKNTVVFTYAAPSDNDKFEGGERVAPADDAVWQNAPSYQAGLYWLKAYVPGTDNYSELVGYDLFNINEGDNEWVTMPGVIAWNWNGYDAAVNLFSGSARSNKPPRFSITKANGDDLELTDFEAASDNDVSITTDTIAVLKSFSFVENNSVVPVNVAQILKALKPANYTLTVTVAGGESLKSLTSSTTFTVGKAANSWVTGKAPAVSSYTYKNYDATTTFTYGETVYGDASAVIYKLDDETFTTNASKPAYVQLQERLANLGAGSYTLYAWVPESANGTYSALYSSGSPYTTRTFTVTRATNDWTNETLVNQISKNYSEIKAASFTQTEFEKLYAQLTPIDGTVNYALLNSDYTSRNKDNLDYAGLFNAIKELRAGEYVIRATVAETTTTNYFGISATDTRLIISSHDNAFTQIPDALTAQWACGLNEDNETVNKTVLDTFEVKATYGTNTVTYTLNKTTYESYAELENAVSALNAGSYNVTIAIAATDDYAGLSEVRMLTVTQGQNSWQNDWAASGSLNVTATAKAALSWGWKTTITWTKAVPVYGNTVYVEIRKANASSALQYVTLDYGVSDGSSAVATISEAISKLDVGNYELIVSAPATVNWAALSDKVEFSITKVTNSWDKAPQIGGASGNKWAHGTNAVPDADAKYGNVRYEYETKSGDKLTSMPTSAGEYVIKFIVDETINYDGISGVLNVTIEKATNRTVSNLNVIGWTWGSYDREINVITGIPEIAELENAPIKFSIGTGIGDSFVALPNLSEFTLTANGLVERDSKVEAALRKLTGGTSKENNLTYYTVRIHVGETTNYIGFTADNMFAVTGATNRIDSLTIKTWEVNHWTDELPSAVALYGAPEITVTGETDGVVYFKGEYKENDDGQLELFVELNNLNLAPKGDYVLTASVKAEIGHYNEPLSRSLPFHIDVKGAGQANYWEELPTVDGWIANIDGLFNAPTGKPVRGLPNFVFYVRNADGSRGQKVDASLTDVVLKKGSKYEADIYIPVEYGDYILVASSMGIPDEEGKSDALAEYEIRVIIDPRPLSFEQELRIPTLLYLGDRKDWADPTSKPSLDDAKITYVYTNKETGVSSTEMPTEAGEYTVTATLSALYSNSVSMSVDFSVKLSPNGWTAAPNIKDWSEESDGNLPTGAATVGTDQIKYTYASVKEPNKILTERPTTEGSYIMYADIDVEGYEPLHAEYRFTIEPAFDTQLVVAAIVLGVFACLLACVVIYFAIKRYKEN